LLTLSLPFILLYLALAYVISIVLTLLYIPRYIVVRRLYWACPFIPAIWKQRPGWLSSFLLRTGFEMAYSINVFRRILTAPIRNEVPSCFILGFPKSGTTSLSNLLKLHPDVRGIDGVPLHEALTKESHFFSGVFGRHYAHQTWLYQTFFPSWFTRWWVEVVHGRRLIVFDGTPTYGMLPHTAERIHRVSPHAKLIVCVRDPVQALFSGEIMLRNLGMQLGYSLIDALRLPNDPRFVQYADEAALWKQLQNLGPTDPLPENLPALFYERLGTLLRAGRFRECLEPFLTRFPRENILVIDFDAIKKDEEAVVRQVLEFIGADASLWKWKSLCPGMKTNYGGRRMHPTVVNYLKRYYEPFNRQLFQLLGRNFDW